MSAGLEARLYGRQDACPYTPKWRPFVQINFTLHRHDSWKHFIDLAYWNVELGEDVTP
ncbi:MAG TPA: hypothetical protein VK815_05735 [Candidatus Acidoferrales bacterium]|nr:hypothetical protein [Candidatus Acidoferrales bacterium]